MAVNDTRDVRIGVSSTRREGLLPSPSNRYLSSTYDTARYVPIGNEFDKESRVKQLGDLGEGLTMWSKAQAEVETTNDSIQSRRMQAEAMEASTQVMNDLANNPETMNNPAVWLDVYRENMSSRIEEINNAYAKSFYVGKNQLLSDEQLRLMLNKEENNVALMAADRVSKMASDETAAALKIAISNRDFDTARAINTSPYFTPAQKLTYDNDIYKAETMDIIQQNVLSDPRGVLDSVGQDGTIVDRSGGRRKLTYEQMQYANNQALGAIQDTQKRTYDGYVQRFLENPAGFSIEDAKKSLNGGNLTTQQYVNLLNMKKNMTAQIKPSLNDFRVTANTLVKGSQAYLSATPEQQASIKSAVERRLNELGFSTSDKNSLLKLLTQGISPETFNSIDSIVNAYWDKGQFPLTKTVDYTGTEGGKTPIFLTQEEYDAQFVNRKKRFQLDKSRQYFDEKTGKDRYAVIETIPNEENILFQEGVKSQTRSIVADRIARYRSENGGKNPPSEDITKWSIKARDEVFNENNIKYINLLDNSSVYPSKQQSNSLKSATLIPNNTRISVYQTNVPIDIPTQGNFIVCAGENTFITDKKNYLDIYKKAGGNPSGFVVIDDFYLSPPSKIDIFDVQSKIYAREIAEQAGLNATEEKGVRCSLLSYWSLATMK